MSMICVPPFILWPSARLFLPLCLWASMALNRIQPGAALAHPLDDGTAILLERSVEATANALGVDGVAYRKIFAPLTAQWNELGRDILGPPRWPRHPVNFARFGLQAMQPARRFAERSFRDSRTRALFAGVAAHSMLPLEKLGIDRFRIGLNGDGSCTGLAACEWRSAKTDRCFDFLFALSGRRSLS